MNNEDCQNIAEPSGFQSDDKRLVPMRSYDKGYSPVVQELRRAFRKFDKWETYGIALGLKKAGKVRLLDIYDAAALVGILPSVVKMRIADLEK